MLQGTNYVISGINRVITSSVNLFSSVAISLWQSVQAMYLLRVVGNIAYMLVDYPIKVVSTVVDFIV